MKDIKKKVILLFIFIVIFIFSSKIIYKEKQNKDSIILDKINEYKVLVKNSKDNNDLDKAFIYLREALNNITSKEIRKYHKEIWNMLSITLNYEEGRDIAINLYEKILKSESKLDKEIKLFINTRLVPLYGISNQYAKALKACMKGIDLSDDLDDKYLKGKLIIDMSNIFRILGEYQTAKEAIKEAISLDIDDKLNNAYIKIYGLINLAEISCILNENDEVLNYTTQIDDYIKIINDKERIDDYKIVKIITLIQAYINMGEYDKAKLYLEEAKVLLEQDKVAYFIDKDIFYMNTYANLKRHDGKYDEAIYIYEKALSLSKERNNIEYISISLTNLIDLYSKVNNKEKLAKSKDELINLLYFEKNILNKDYINFAITQYENEKIEKDNLKKNILNYIIFIMSIIILIITLIYITRLDYINKIDHLTGAYNRRYFDKLYSKLSNKKSQCSIIMFDIDNFKLINDNYGHNFGDQVLIQISKNIKNILNKSDKLFRYGGEEFIILSQNKDKEYTINLAELTRKSIEDMKWNKDIIVTISIGVCYDKEDNIDLLKVADENLYISKATGKNKVTINK